jgi:hypothetical protein
MFIPNVDVSNQFHRTGISPSNLKRITSSFSCSRSTSFLSASNIHEDFSILTNQDLITGAFMAVSLAFLFSFLQGISPSSSSFRLWPVDEKSSMNDNITEPMENLRKDESVFSEWREMSKPENYILYANKIRQKSKATTTGSSMLTSANDPSDTVRTEKRIVLFALLILFVPIFSVEFFFALSRQLICGNYVFHPDDAAILRNQNIGNDLVPWAKELCSPHFDF